MTRCPICEDGGTVLAAVGPVDAFGVPDGTVECPCPACAAGDAEAVYRAGLSSSSAAQSERGHGDNRSRLATSNRSKRADQFGVSGSLVRGGDPDPSLNPRKAA